jgi:DNA-binding GntR family transcriptional regulator
MLMRVERNTKTLREMATEKLRDAILSLHLRPGHRLVERTLCDQLGVSRSVVREVLRHLEAEGLVVHEGRGPSVARPTADQARQIYEIRGHLEALAARACAEAGRPDIAHALNTALNAIRNAYASGTTRAVLDATGEFYQLLFDGGGKDVAWGIVCSLNARITQLRSMTIGTPGRREEGPEQMARIVEAIRDGDGERAYQACLIHVGQAAELAQRQLAAMKQE